MKLHARSLPANLIQIGLFGLGLPILGSLASIHLVPHWHFAHEPSHAVIEALGGFIAVLIVILLYVSERSSEEKTPKLIWITSALLSMGLLDIVHAAMSVGKSFVWFHSTATFAGGVLFMLVWLPERFERNLRSLPHGIVASTLCSAAFFLAFPQVIPPMVEDGQFTPLARLLNIMGGIGFVAACAYFIRNLVRDGDIDAGVLAAHCLLFGAAGILFELSTLWDAAWWWWHLLRLCAYLVLTYFFFEMFEQISANIVRSRDEARIAQKELEAWTEEIEKQKVQIEDALNKERELNGLQRQFVAMVSHEFRTPLAIIDGNAQRLLKRLDKAPKERMEKALNTVRLSVHRLVDLMESVLAAARLENGQIRIDPKPFSLTDLVREVSSSHLGLHPDHRIDLDLDGLPEQITGDEKLIRQVISNILSNAIKYSPNAADIWIEGSIDERERATVSIRDQGLGIPPAEQKRLFERFFRASTSTGIAGTGIGLHLAYHLVQLHGGTIDVVSAEGKGTTFFVRLPIDGPEMTNDVSIPRHDGDDQVGRLAS